MSQKWSDYQDYVDASMLGGKAWTLTIKGVQDEKMFDREAQADEEKPVLYFMGTEKGLVLTNTNRKKLRELFGDMIADCIGKKVNLQAVQVKAFGKLQDVVRIFEADEGKTQSAAIAHEGMGEPRVETAAVSLSAEASRASERSQEPNEKLEAARATMNGLAEPKQSANGNHVASPNSQFWGFVKLNGIAKQMALQALEQKGGDYVEARALLEREFVLKAA